MHYTTTLSAMVVIASAVSALQLNINNWCSQDVYFYQANGAIPANNPNCNMGPDLTCGSAPAKIPAGNGGSSVYNLAVIDNGSGTSIKFAKGNNFDNGILQLEINDAGAIWWDLSDLDGAGAGLVGTPFANDNVKISPTGDGSDVGTCTKIRCAAGQVCLDAYQHPDDTDTRWCPDDTGIMWLDLCEPENLFVNKRRAISFEA